MKNRRYMLFLSLIIYLIFSILSGIFLNIKINNYINSTFWIVMSIILLFNKNYYKRFRNYDENAKTVLIATLFYIIIYFISGLIFGYVKNIYSLSNFPINFIRIIIPIIGIEITRSYIVNQDKNSLFFTTFIFILLEVNYYSLFSNISTVDSTFSYVTSSILPLIFGNILYTYLSIKGSYKLTLMYRLIISTALLVSPIIPNYNWFLSGINGIISPSFIYLFLKNYVSSQRHIVRKAENPFIYIPFLTIIIIFTLFMTGIFKYAPRAIMSNSMNPLFYRGDVVIYCKVDDNKLKNIKRYNIIIYNRGDQMIVHRVIDKYEKNGKMYYVTQGDANDVIDPVVEENQIVGIYMTHIKYVGYPTVYLHELLNQK